jgi:hypothetical protein
VALGPGGPALRTAVGEADGLRGGQRWWSFVRTTKKPEMAVVLLKDTAAELGLILAGPPVPNRVQVTDTLFDHGTSRCYDGPTVS